MKRTSFILSLIAVATMAVSCNNAPAATEAQAEANAQKGAIVYFNLDTVLNEYDMANDLKSVVDTKVQGINEEVNRRGNKLQKELNAFQEKIDKGLLTRSVAEVQSQKLQEQQNEFQNYAAQKQQEIYEEQSVMINQIYDAVNAYVAKYNEEKQYAMILAVQGDILQIPVVTGDPDLDITQALIDGLNAEYVKTKSNK